MVGDVMNDYQRIVHGSGNIGALLRPLIGIVFFCALSAVIFPLHAEELTDPTRPPANIFQAASRSAGTEAAQPSGLRSIIISETRRAAIIDGKTVELGGRFGNARLVEVNPGSIVLQRGKSRQVLTLFPGVKITREEITAAGPPNMETPKIESSDKNTQVVQPSQSIDSTSPSQESKTAEHEENLLPGHPKEEK